MSRSKHPFIMSLLFLLFIFLGQASGGETYYVSPAGSNQNSGSITSPLRSLSLTLNVVSAGDTIMMRGGSHHLDEIFIDKEKGMGGKPGRYLTIKAFEGEKPILSSHAARLVIHADYVRVEGLHFVMPLRCEAVGQNLEIVNNEFSGSQPQSAAIEAGGQNLLVQGNHIRFQGNEGDSQDHGISVHAGENVAIKDNIVIGSSGYGIQVFDEHKSTNPADWAANPIVMRNYVIAGNLISGSKQRSGLMIAKGRGGQFITLDSLAVVKNIFIENAQFGLFIREGQNITVFNNTFYGDKLASLLVRYPSAEGVEAASDIKMTNNIFSPAAEVHVTNSSPGENIQLDTNLYDSSPGLNGIEDAYPFTGNPRFLNVRNANFDLLTTSPAVDAGLDVGLPYFGSAPDIGAIEFTEHRVDRALTHAVVARNTPTGMGAGLEDNVDLYGNFDPSQIPVEGQAWWAPNFGHIHAAVKLPFGQEVSGVLDLDVRIVLKDNPSKLNELRIDTDNGVLIRVPLDEECPYDGTETNICAFSVPVQLDTREMQDGWRELRVRAQTVTPDGKKFLNSTGIPLLVNNGGSSSSDYNRFCDNTSMIGRGWYEGFGYSNAIVCAPLQPVSGIHTFQVRAQKDSRRLTVTLDRSHFIPAVGSWGAQRAMDGQVLFDEEGNFKSFFPITVDTRTLSDGWHQISVKSEGPDGDVSECSHCNGEINHPAGVARVWFYVKNGTSLAPAITSFSPGSGQVGDEVTISGNNFTGATSVEFNGTPATTFTIDSDSQIRANVPQGATTGKISVTNADGTGFSNTDLTVTSLAPPTISSFSPASGQVGDPVTITGTNFGTATSVKFNGTPAVFTIDSATQIQTNVPTGAPSGKISVTNPDGTATSSQDFSVIASLKPIITSFSPASGGVGVEVTITGTNFSTATSVEFNGTPVTSPTIDSDTQIRANVPVAATTGKITVTNPSGTGTSSADFTVLSSNAPTISSFSPASGEVGTEVTILGANFNGVTAVLFDNAEADFFTIDSDVQIRADVPLTATTGKISVVAPPDTAVSNETFTVILPEGGLDTLFFSPIEDAFVTSGDPTRNFGSQNVLAIRNQSPIYTSYLKFDLGGISGTVQKSTLRLFSVRVLNSQSHSGAVHSVSNEYLNSASAWNETGINWNNAPEINSPALDNGTTIGEGQWIELDVSSAVNGDGTYSFALFSDISAGVAYRSKEHNQKPVLMIEVQTTPSPVGSGLDLSKPAQKSASGEVATLLPNYPNPFNPDTQIRYQLSQAAKVQINIFNVKGQLTRTLVEAHQSAGFQQVRWDSKNNAGTHVASGIYFVQLKAGQLNLTRRITLKK